MEKEKHPFYLQLSLRLLSAVIILFLMYIGKGMFVPLCLAGIFTLGLATPCGWLEGKGFNKSLAAAVCVLVSLVIVALIIFFISMQMANFKEDLPKLKIQFNQGLAEGEKFLHDKFNLSHSSLVKYLSELEDTMLSHSSTLVGTTFATLTTVILYFVLVPIYTFLMLIYRGQVVRFLEESFDDKYKGHVHEVVQNTKIVIRSYVGGLGIEMLIVAALICIGLSVLGVKYAILLGILGAVMNIIPYLGIFTAILISFLITISTNGISTALLTIVILAIIHMIDSNILLPKIVGSKVKINALVTIVVVILGENIWGIPGMFLSVPLIAILKVICDGSVGMKPWGILLGAEEKPKK